MRDAVLFLHMEVVADRGFVLCHLVDAVDGGGPAMDLGQFSHPVKRRQIAPDGGFRAIQEFRQFQNRYGLFFLQKFENGGIPFFCQHFDHFLCSYNTVNINQSQSKSIKNMTKNERMSYAKQTIYKDNAVYSVKTNG